MAGGLARTGACARARQATRQTDAGLPRGGGARFVSPLTAAVSSKFFQKGAAMMGQFIGAQGIQRGGPGRPTPAVRGPLAPLCGRRGGNSGRNGAETCNFGPNWGHSWGLLEPEPPSIRAFGAGFISVSGGCSQASCDGTHVLPSFLCLPVVLCPRQGAYPVLCWRPGGKRGSADAVERPAARRRRVPRPEPPRNHAPQPTARRRVQGQGGHCTPQAAQARTAATHGAKAAGRRIAGGPRSAQSRPQAARGEPHLLCLVGGITAPHRTPGPR